MNPLKSKNLVFTQFLLLSNLSLTAVAQTQPVQPTPPAQPAPATPQPPVRTPPKTPRPPVVKPEPRPEPAPIPVPENAKSEEQKAYERKMQGRFDEAVKQIRELESRLEDLDQEGKNITWSFLHTAQGNRSVARTKLKQLRFITPNQWYSLQNGIDKAFANLDTSIKRLQDYAKSFESTQTPE